MGVDAAGMGPIGWGLLVFLIALVVTSIGAARHPLTLRQLPLIRAGERLIPQRLDAVARRLQARVGMSGATLAAAMLGLVTAAVLAVGFTAVLDDVLEGEGIAQFDDPIAHWLAAHREVRLTGLLLHVTRLGNADAQTIWLVLVCAVATLRAKSWIPALVGAVGGAGIALVIVIAKVSVGRQRPPLPYAVMPVGGYSFPSGHATGAAAVGLLSAWILCRWVLRERAAQFAVWSATIGMIGLIGFSRCYLGVHFVTDVLAGWLLGTAWAASVILLTAWRSRETAAPTGKSR